LAVRREGELLPFDLGFGVDAAHVGGVRGAGIHLGVYFGVEANIDRARVHETADPVRLACADEVLDAAYVDVVRSLTIGLRSAAPSEERELCGRVKDRIDALAGFHHAVGVFDFASNDLEVRVLELEGRIADDGADRVPLLEKASNQVAA
jgi:hypothetical protein